MVGSWIILRVSTVLLITLFPSLCLSKCTADYDEISCINTNSDYYVYEINKVVLQNKEVIKINNSHLPIISDFSKGIIRNAFTNIIINHCNVSKVGNHAFGQSVKKVDLSFNKIENMTFVSFLKPGWSVNLSHNRIKNISFICDYWPVEYYNEKEYDYDYYERPTPKSLVVYSDLDLSHNEIEYVGKDNNWLPLKTLDLSHNKLIRFYFGENLTSSSINLAHNNDLESLTYSVFYIVQDLKSSNSISRLSENDLDISNTVLKSSAFDFYSYSIYMSNCSLKTVTSTFGAFKRKVDFSHNSLILFKPNDLNEWTTDIYDLDLSFNNFNSTSWLFNINPMKVDLSHNNLVELVSSDALINATYLDLSFNYDLQLSTHSLWNRKSLMGLDLSFCNMSEIPDKLFQHSNNLISLILDNNQIHHLSKGVFHNLSSVEYINLDSNRLTNIQGFLFSSIPVELIDISNNYIHFIATNAFFNLSRLSNVLLDNNGLLQIENAAFNHLPIEQLSLQNCQLTKFNAAVVNSSRILYFLNLAGNSLAEIEFPRKFRLSDLRLTFNGNLTTKFLKNLPNLRSLTFQNSIIFNIENLTFMRFPELLELSFEQSKVINVDSGFLNGLFSLQKLDLKMFVPNISTLNNDTFEDLHSLQELDLSQLHIEDIQSGAFNGLKQIKHLNLSHNELSSIEISFENLPTLKTLDISFNKLKTLPQGLSPDLKVDYHHNSIALQTSKSQVEDISKQCSCEKSELDDDKSHF